MANTAIIHTRHPIPTVDDLIHALNGAPTFSKLDIRNAYYTLEVEPQSQNITSFSTHAGLSYTGTIFCSREYAQAVKYSATPFNNYSMAYLA